MKQGLLACTVLCLIGVILSGCTQERKYQPGADYPEWAFDKPGYYEPAVDPEPFHRGVDGQPDVYYSNQRTVFVKHPGGDVRNAPRPMVYVTKDHGQTWEKMGYFGREQRYFALQVKDDGQYGICVLSGEQSELSPVNLQVQLIYVVDTQSPQISVTVNPEDGPYWVGQQIEVGWQISDPHLDDLPAQVYSRLVEPDKEPVWKLRETQLAATGSMTVTIEQLPSKVEGMQFRIEAKDQMGNVATGHTPLLRLSYPLPGSAHSTRIAAPPPTVRNKWSGQPAEATPIADQPAVVVLSSSQTRELRAEVEAFQTDTAEEHQPRSWSTSNQAMEVLQTYQQSPDDVLTVSAQAQASASEDPELAELERLLAEVSGPVYKGKVHRQPAKPMALADRKAGSSEPLTSAEPQTESSGRLATVATPPTVEPIPAQAEKPYAAQSESRSVEVPEESPPEIALKPVNTEQKTPAEPMLEPAPQVITVPEVAQSESKPLAPEQEVPVVEPAVPVEPIMQVEPPVVSEPHSIAVQPVLPETVPAAEASSPWVLPEPIIVQPSISVPPTEPIVTPEPIHPAESTPIVTIEIPAIAETPAPAETPETVEVPQKPTDEKPAPAIVEVPQEPAAVSHGPKNMAKPWERLGNPDAAAKNFYRYAPSLSNY